MNTRFLLFFLACANAQLDPKILSVSSKLRLQGNEIEFATATSTVAVDDLALTSALSTLEDALSSRITTAVSSTAVAQSSLRTAVSSVQNSLVGVGGDVALLATHLNVSHTSLNTSFQELLSREILALNASLGGELSSCCQFSHDLSTGTSAAVSSLTMQLQSQASTAATLSTALSASAQQLSAALQALNASQSSALAMLQQSWSSAQQSTQAALSSSESTASMLSSALSTSWQQLSAALQALNASQSSALQQVQQSWSSAQQSVLTRVSNAETAATANSAMLVSLAQNITLLRASLGLVRGNGLLVANSSADMLPLLAPGALVFRTDNEELWMSGDGVSWRKVDTQFAGAPDLFGTGRDGDVTLNAVFTVASTSLSTSSNAGVTALNVISTAGFSSGDELIILIMQGSLAGLFEHAVVATIVSGTQMTLTAPLINSYPTSNVKVQKVPHYNNVAVGSVTAAAWSTSSMNGGLISFRALGTVTVLTGMDASGAGYPGGGSAADGSGDSGASWTGPSSASRSNNGGGGGGGTECVWSGGDTIGSSGAGGSYGSVGTAGTPSGSGVHCQNCGLGTPGATYGSSTLSWLFLGSGGGGAGGENSNPSSVPGARGGGIIYIFASAMVLQSGAFIRSNGANGPAGANGDAGGGGGGSGGSVRVTVGSLTTAAAGQIVALGGSGGSPGGWCSSNGGATGGNGGVGRVRIDVDLVNGVEPTLADLNVANPAPMLTRLNLGTSRDPNFGSGNDGIFSMTSAFSPTATKLNGASAGATVLNVVSALGFAEGDEVLIIDLQQATSTGSTAGTYEFGLVNQVTGSTLTLQQGLRNAYPSADKVAVYRVPNYDTVTVTSSPSLSAWNPTDSFGGLLVFRARRSATINAAIDVSGMGFRGGYATHSGMGFAGESWNVPGNPQQQSGNAGGGGAGIECTWNGGDTIASAGGGGGHGTAGESNTGSGNCQTRCQPATSGSAYGVADLSKIYLGSGGGGSGGENSVSSGTYKYGGNGGGIIMIFAQTLSINSGGALRANGNSGQSYIASDAGGNGGGSGGSVFVKAQTLQASSSFISATGGSGSGAGGWCSGSGDADGRDGAVGRVRVEYGVLEGTSNAASLSNPLAATAVF
eukprot:m.264490 g.264490  ORF g.264490 m.264490 type:complete len:1115 (-) comp22774_c0_seq1:139-3483(-)